MKRQRWIWALRVALFCALTAAAAAGLSRVMQRKEDVMRIRPFVEQGKEMDVLFLGDSLVMNGVYPLELWKRYGIASYNVACPNSPMAVRYWTLLNALDYAAPKLVVLDIKDIDDEGRLPESSGTLHNSLDIWPASATKARAVLDLLDDPEAMDSEGNRYMDLRAEFLFTLARYHSRWKELTQEDFHPAPNREKGAEMAVRINDPREYTLVDENARMEENVDGFASLRRIIEETQRRDIPLLLVHMPHPSAEHSQLAANTVRDIAEEYGVPFADLVRMDCVVDYSIDMHDPKAHLNPSGARKATDFLGRYIMDHFDIPDRRGEAAYAHWDAEYDAYVNGKLEALRGETDPQNALMLLHDADFSACVAVREGVNYGKNRLERLLQNIPREHVFEEDVGQKWAHELEPLGELQYAETERSAYLLAMDRWYSEAHEWVGGGEGEIGTSFGTLAFRQEDGFALTIRHEDGEEHFFGEEAQDADLWIVVIDERTGEAAAVLSYKL